MHNERDRAIFAALGNTTRLRIVELIAEAGTAGTLPSELADAVGVPRNLLGAHLLVLEKAGIVVAEKRGRNRICRIEAVALSTVATALERLANMAGQKKTKE